MPNRPPEHDDCPELVDHDHQHPVGPEAAHGMLPRSTVVRGTTNAGARLKSISDTAEDDSKPEA